MTRHWWWRCRAAVPMLVATVTIAAFAFLWLADSPRFCRGAPGEYRELRWLPVGEQAAALRRYPMMLRVDVFLAEQRCGRPSVLAVDDIAPRDSPLDVPEALRLLTRAERPLEKGVFLALIARETCTRGIPPALVANVVDAAHASLDSMLDEPGYAQAAASYATLHRCLRAR